MIVLSEKYQASQVARLWKQQYGRLFADPSHPMFNKVPALDTYNTLVKMDGKGTADEYARVIGNTSKCCETRCDECGVESWNVVQLGEEPDYESATARVCLGCLRKAVALLEGGDCAGMPSDQKGVSHG